ncbi:cytochrome c oxidase subunit 8B, mitochondrial-like, partial [Pelobates cultripes]
FLLVSSRIGSLTLCLVRCFLRSQFPRGLRRLVRKLRFRCYPRIRLLPGADWTLYLTDTYRVGPDTQTITMPLFTRTLGLLRRTAFPQVTSKAGIVHKPAKDALTAAQQGIGLGVLFMVFMIPSGWILAHMEDYKSRGNIDDTVYWLSLVALVMLLESNGSEAVVLQQENKIE